MPDPATLGVVATMIGLNMTMLGLVLRQIMNGSKPKLPKNNPQPVDPKDMDSYRLGDVSVAYFKDEFVTPIIEAIKESK
jgi:hypothetical protein